MIPAVPALLALAVAAVVFLRVTVFSGSQVRSMRWRIRLHLHPGPGFASFAELWCRWSRHAAIGHGRRARPGLRLRHRLTARTTDYAVRLGRGQWFRRAYGRLEDQVLVCAAPRTGKSGLVADRILDHPGPVLATSTRADLYESTAGARLRRGPVHVFNPQGTGGVPSTLQWDLLGPCRDLVMARRMASWLKVPGISGDLRWFEQKGDVALAALLWAAAVTGRSILDVYEWVQLHGHVTCLEILAGHPGSSRQLFAVVKRMFEENRTSGSIRDTVDLTLSWSILPGLAEAVTPGPGEGFSASDFTRDCGTLYLIASGDDDSPLTSVFRALASWCHYEAGLAGSRGRHRRLDPPLLMALDEVTQVCPVDLPVMLSDSAGKGVLVTAVCHSVSQLEHRWGKQGADTIWSTCGTKVLLGGISDPDTLERTSKLCGTIRAGDGTG
ncbi:MAG: type IV secretory system conjugative DNA transfer family protein, partial [Streptosporangiaceae bacterium]